MRLLTRFLIFVTVLLLGSRMVAQVHPKVPRGHEEFLSGGATSPDLEKRGARTQKSNTSGPDRSENWY